MRPQLGVSVDTECQSDTVGLFPPKCKVLYSSLCGTVWNNFHVKLHEAKESAAHHGLMNCPGRKTESYDIDKETVLMWIGHVMAET